MRHDAAGDAVRQGRRDVAAEAALPNRSMKVLTYGTAPHADIRLDVHAVGPDRASGRLQVGGDWLALQVPQPGRHNLENATAALLLAGELGVPAAEAATLLAGFPGVARRFEVVGTARDGIRVVDDYAHNGEKLRAAITAAQAGAPRVVAVFQPHGFGPARFLRPELRQLLPQLLRPRDRFCYAEVFYAGGTVSRDVSSRMLADDLPSNLQCGYARDHDGVVEWVRREARAGDTVLIMGARDPELPALARRVLAALAS
jgi:UDP-N-acetylmuramate--alanine ligase